MDLNSVRDALLEAQDQQLASEQANLAMNNTLGQQQIAYQNDARGTLYSGTPTWQRAQLAQQLTGSQASLLQGYANNRVRIYNNIADAIDRINSYNEAAAALGRTSGNTSQDYMDLLIQSGMLGGTQ